MSDLISDKETQRLILAAVSGTDGGVTPERLIDVVDWAAQVRADSALLGLVLEGDMNIRVPESKDEELMFSLTDQGKKRAKRTTR